MRDLTTRPGTNATNSGIPPSANPPDAPKPVVKQRTGKTRGGQPGHPAHLKRRLPSERVQHVVPFLPSHCNHCAAALPRQAGPDGPEPIGAVINRPAHRNNVTGSGVNRPTPVDLITS